MTMQNQMQIATNKMLATPSTCGIASCGSVSDGTNPAECVRAGVANNLPSNEDYLLIKGAFSMGTGTPPGMQYRLI